MKKHLLRLHFRCEQIHKRCISTFLFWIFFGVSSLLSAFFVIILYFTIYIIISLGDENSYNHEMDIRINVTISCFECFKGLLNVLFPLNVFLIFCSGLNTIMKHLGAIIQIIRPKLEPKISYISNKRKLSQRIDKLV